MVELTSSVCFQLAACVRGGRRMGSATSLKALKTSDKPRGLRTLFFLLWCTRQPASWDAHPVVPSNTGPV